MSLKRLKELPVEAKNDTAEDSGYFSISIPKEGESSNDKSSGTTTKKSAPTDKKTKVTAIGRTAKVKPTSSPKTNVVTRARQKPILKIPQMDGADDSTSKSSRKPNLGKLPKRAARTKAVTAIAKKKPSKTRSDNDDDVDDDDGDSDFAPSPPKRVNRRNTILVESKGNPLLRCKQSSVIFSEDEKNTEKEKEASRANYWVEVFCEKEEKWIAIDLLAAKVDAVEKLRVS